MKKTYTFLILNNGKTTTKKWVLSQRHLMAFFTVCAIGAMGVSAMAFDYVSLLYQARQGRGLYDQNQKLESDLGALAGKMSSVEKSLQRLGVFAKKLRTITAVEDPNRDLTLLMDAANGRKNNWVAPLGLGDGKERILEDDRVAYEGTAADLEVRMDTVIASSKMKEQNLLQLWQSLSDQMELLASTPSLMPTDGWLTSRFGYRKSPFGTRKSMHKGLDIAAAFGTPVKAPAAGVVSYVGFDGGYGNLISIDHGYGVVTRYGHNSKVRVKYGQRVERGDIIAEVGNTGRSTGPHLHYEVRLNGIAVDPQKYILEDEY